MAFQVPDEVGSRTPPHVAGLLPTAEAAAAMSVQQAKANLLGLGMEAEAERRQRVPMVRKAIVWLPVITAVAGLLLGTGTKIAAMRREKQRAAAPQRFSFRGLVPPDPKSKREARSAIAGLSFATLFKLARPAIPVIVKYLSLRRQAMQARRAAAAAAAKNNSPRWGRATA
jgi:hypothetical protein